MNGLLFVPQPALSPRERMTSALDAFAFGLLPELSCDDCRASVAGRCPRCAEKLIAVAALNDGIDAVESAPDEDTATAACLRSVLTVLGISEAGAVRALSAATPGGDAGTKN